MRAEDAIGELEMMQEPLWADTIIPWLKQHAEDLSKAGVECELSMRGTVRDGLRPGLLFQNPRAGAGSVYFVYLEPCDLDEGTGFLLTISLEKESEETGRSAQIWRFPLLVFPEIGRGDWDLYDYVCLFEDLRKKRGSADVRGPLPQGIYEISRLNGLFSILTEMGADPRMRTPDDAAPFIEVMDEDHLLRFSCRLIDEVDENWILTAELCSRGSENTSEEEPLIRFDIPELGGLLEEESYGMLIEIMESLTA